MEPTFTPNLKIARVARDSDKGSKILDFRDMIEFVVDPEAKKPLSEGKIILTFTDKTVEFDQYRHYIDVPVARRVFFDILNGKWVKDEKNEYKPLLNEYKGGRATKQDPKEWQYVSRHLTITRTDKLRMGPAVTFTFELTEGVPADKGAVTPKSGAKKYQAFITITMDEARTIAADILANMDAKLAAFWTLRLNDAQRTARRGARAREPEQLQEAA